LVLEAEVPGRLAEALLEREAALVDRIGRAIVLEHIADLRPVRIAGIALAVGDDRFAIVPRVAGAGSEIQAVEQHVEFLRRLPEYRFAGVLAIRIGQVPARELERNRLRYLVA